MNSTELEKYVERFWEQSADMFGTDVTRKTHPMNTAFMTFVEMLKENETDSESEDEDKTKDDFAECCRCGEEEVDGQGQLVDGEFWCDDCLDEAEECELCKKWTQNPEYLPSKEDQEKQQILGNDYCLECYKKVEKFEFVENIE